MTTPNSLGLQIRFNGRLEHLRGSALGFRNLTNYIAYAECPHKRWYVALVVMLTGS